jgi:hypothetical protein
LTKKGHAKLPFLWKPLYGYLLHQPHVDKLGVEKAIFHSAGWKWEEKSPSDKFMALNGPDWEKDLPAEGTYKDVIILRPMFFTDGECTGKYRAEARELTGWYISRKEVAHFIAEQAVKHWDDWKGKIVDLTY